MPPDFKKSTVDKLAQRSAYVCSNPECRAQTVGPHSDDEKATSIGEAAHICGARAGSARYDPTQTDYSRAEITNAIWLCRNCHKLIDADAERYPTGLLFSWREQHEKETSSRLGNTNEGLRVVELESRIAGFAELPPVVRRILLDKPDGWELRLASEFLKALTEEPFRKLDDLKSGLYVKRRKFVDEPDAFSWIDQNVTEMSGIFEPITGLMKKLTASLGQPGVSGDSKAIIHSCRLVRSWLDQVISFEEDLWFTQVPDEFQKLRKLLIDCAGSQARKLEEIPESLDSVVAMIGTDHGGTEDEPIIIEKNIEIVLPNNWSRDFSREFKRVEKRYSASQGGGFSWLGWSIFLILFVSTCAAMI